MYFKSLEMFGFKSFADRTKLDFERGITGVVGPNGCGKSNILDAVKWVLGEQSAKQMRGSCMEDVIFNGTELREQLGFAEVSLTLSNEEKFLPIEYDEVTISRRLYRSGESEYLINKNPVRLKDINEMLMGSGIGTSAYSIIEQGKIDQILSANPEERRKVFEEASGITKYKSKKREAIRKLEYTEQNLLRVNDIIKEVERQINSIERQARKAKRYQELFDRLKELDTKLAAYKYKEMNDKKDDLTGENNEIKNKETELHNFISEFSASVERLKNEKDELDSRISQYSNEYRDTGTSLERSKGKVTLDKERLQELYRHESEQKSEIESLNKRIEDLSKNVEEIIAKLMAISENSKSKENELSAKAQELSGLKARIRENAELIKDNKAKSVDVLSAQSKLRNEITKITSDRQNISSRIRRLSVEKENVAKEIIGLEGNLSEVRLSVNATISKIEILERERIGLQNHLKNEKEGYALLDKKINDSKNYILSLCSKLSLLEDLIKRNEGFTGGTQALLNCLSEGKLALDGFCVPLAELLEPKWGYEAVSEAALNGNMQAIIVDEWPTAFTALDFLQKNGLGKASFIKNEFTHQDTQEIILDDSLVKGPVKDFIRFNERFTPLFNKLLNGHFVVDSIDDGLIVLNGLPEDIQKKVKFITTNGDMITKSKITGGSVIRDFTSSIIGRHARMKEIEIHIADLEKELLKLKQELHVKREIIEDLQEKTKKAEEALRAEEIEFTQKKSQELSLEKERNKIKEEVDLVNLELDESMYSEHDLKERESDTRKKLENIRNEEASLQCLIMDSQAYMEEGAKKKEEFIISITQIQTEISSLRKEEDEFLKRAEIQKNYHEEQVNIFEEKKGSLEKTVLRQKELDEEIISIENDINCLTERSDLLSKELGMLEDESLQRKGVITEKGGELGKKKEDLGVIKDKLHSLEMEGTQLSFQMETLRSKIDQIYKVDLDMTLPGLEGMEDPESVQREVDELSQKVEKIGPVNLVAIGEHKELEERFEFLKRQHTDLVDGKELLHKVIRKINHTTKELFMETFVSIQEEFKKYFKFLFGGGKAEIVMLDEGDVLESGIEIIVRPPGKKLQTISLLSGGEKALTAIALLFAIFKCKPTPFCILDEIDAPLDESNIGRFCKTLQEFAKQSQFIIITHNKKTMTAVDLMYGITMERSGVSKIISVKFGDRAKKEEEAVLA